MRSVSGFATKNASAARASSGRPGKIVQASASTSTAVDRHEQRVQQLAHVLGVVQTDRLADLDRAARKRVPERRRVVGAGATGNLAVLDETARVRDVLRGVVAADRRVGERVPDGDQREEPDQHRGRNPHRASPVDREDAQAGVRRTLGGMCS